MPETIKHKRCSTCKTVKAICCFAKNQSHKSGLQNQCRDCCKTYRGTKQAKLSREILIAKWLKDRRNNRVKLPSHINCSKCKAIKARSCFPKDSASKTGYSNCCKYCFKKYQHTDSNRPKFRAHGAVKRAVKHGVLPAAKACTCSRCPATARLYHHPNGYDKAHQLDVKPLCNSCHVSIHNTRYQKF